MTYIPGNLTVAQLAEMAKHTPGMPQYFRLVLCKTYEEFIEIVNDEIDVTLGEFQDNANRFQDHSEDAFNFSICQVLRRSGFDAQHDPNQRGHVDISIKYGKFTYLFEGKVVDSVNNSYLSKGYGQLTTRYVTGSTNGWACSLLIYCFAPSAIHVLNAWKGHLKAADSTKPNYASDISDCPKEPNFAFNTNHAHESSGATLRIRHRICSLHFSPKTT